MDLTIGCVHALLILFGSLGYLTTAFSSNSTDTQYVHLLDKVKTPVMAEIDLSKLGEQLKSFMKNEIEKVITERIALESAKNYNKLENNFNSAIENFTTSMEAYTDGVLNNTSIIMQMDIERKLNNTFTRGVRRFRTIMHSDIRSNLQSVKRKIDSFLSESYNKSNACYPDRKTFRKLSGKFKDLSKQLKHQSYNRKGYEKNVKVTELSSEINAKDHKGRLFYTMFPIQPGSSYSYNVQFIITADTQTDVDIISKYAEINRTVVITTGVAYIDIPSLAINTETGRTFTTVMISANQLITVVELFSKSYCKYNSPCDSSSFIVLPFNKLGRQYSLITYPKDLQNCGVMATVKNTTVVIESASMKNISVQSAIIKPGQKFNLVLDYLEGFNINTDTNLTGTKFSANKPIVVISGNKYASFKKGSRCYEYCNNLSDTVYESLIPADKWSRNFIIPLFHKASSVKIRIVSRNGNNTIKIDDNSPWPKTVHGDKIEVDLFVRSYYVSASYPILLSIYVISENKGLAMSIVPGIDHFSKEYVIAPPNHPAYTNYISIIIRSSDVDGLRFVGSLFSVETSVIMARNESFTTVIKKMAGLSVYKIRHVSKTALYGVIVYGFGGSTAYGYPAGFRL